MTEEIPVAENNDRSGLRPVVAGGPDYRPRFDIRQVTFDEPEVTIQYMHLPTDVRARGALVATHTLTVSAKHPGWHNEIDDLKNAAYHLLTDALDDFEEANVVDMQDLLGDGEEEDERGMGE
jgi:hypothetical protein